MCDTSRGMSKRMKHKHTDKITEFQASWIQNIIITPFAVIRRPGDLGEAVLAGLVIWVGEAIFAMSCQDIYRHIPRQ